MAKDDTSALIPILLVGIIGYFVWKNYSAGATATHTQVVSPQGQPQGTTAQPPAIGTTTTAAPGTTFYSPIGTATIVDNTGTVIPLP